MLESVPTADKPFPPKLNLHYWTWRLGLLTEPAHAPALIRMLHREAAGTYINETHGCIQLLRTRVLEAITGKKGSVGRTWNRPQREFFTQQGQAARVFDHPRPTRYEYQESRAFFHAKYLDYLRQIGLEDDENCPDVKIVAGNMSRDRHVVTHLEPLLSQTPIATFPGIRDFLENHEFYPVKPLPEMPVETNSPVFRGVKRW